MRVDLRVSPKSLKDFDRQCEATIMKVGTGSRKALVAALEDISEASFAQVPQDTSTLAYSQFYEVTGDWRNGWQGVIGYGGNGDPINPKTGKPASSYMMAVHEDLTAQHPIGKAKFLEDPIREYAREKFPRTVISVLRSVLSR